MPESGSGPREEGKSFTVALGTGPESPLPSAAAEWQAGPLEHDACPVHVPRAKEDAQRLPRKPCPRATRKVERLDDVATNFDQEPSPVRRDSRVSIRIRWQQVEGEGRAVAAHRDHARVLETDWREHQRPRRRQSQCQLTGGEPLDRSVRQNRDGRAARRSGARVERHREQSTVPREEQVAGGRPDGSRRSLNHHRPQSSVNRHGLRA